MGRISRTAVGTGAAAVACAALVAVGAAPAAAADAATADAYCSVTATVAAQWSTGYGVLLAVRNTSGVPVLWRQLDARFPGPILSAQPWNATATLVGRQTSFVPSTPTGVLSPGQTVTIGAVYASGSVTIPQSAVTCSPA